MTRAEYYADLAVFWGGLVRHELLFHQDVERIVSTARMCGHFGQVALDAQRVDVLESGLIEQGLRDWQRRNDD